MAKAGYVYIMTNRKDGVLYIGVTSNLERRDYQHKAKVIKSFTTRYNLNKLVYYEMFEDMNNAIAREKQLKKYYRYQKIALIEKLNPEWRDLLESPVT